MTWLHLLLLALTFCATLGLMLLVLRPFGAPAVQARLQAQAGMGADTRRGGRWLAPLLRLAVPLGKWSLPAENWEASPLRLRFLHAGLRAPAAPLLFFAAKTALAAGLPAALFFLLLHWQPKLAGSALLLCLCLLATCGYYLPNLVLTRLARQRQRDIVDTFPDALDLMTVCVEAGLGMDAALARVAAEIALKSTVVSEELTLVTLELRAGSNKETALRNLAMRTGVEDVDILATMLIQAERFGTGIGASLRVLSEQLRTRRRQGAEEQAAKISLKLLFPLIFFIFPSLLVVLMGPAILQIYRQLLPAMANAS